MITQKNTSRLAAVRKPILFACGLALLVIGGNSAAAADETSDSAPRRFTTDGRQTIGGVQVRYTAIVAETFLTDPEGKRTASLVSTSYIRNRLPADVARPVVFVFNGGPGSSSLWLHMGLVGPRRVAFGDDVHPETTPPFRIADNADSILDVADVVLFDPPGTGFSRVLPDGKTEEFYGVAQDAQATVRFIEAWVNEHRRWQSPRFLMGESYGTVRAAVVARLLSGGPMGTGSMEGLTLNGVILLGQAMGSVDGDMSFVTSLPTLAATAWYHGRTDRDGTTLRQHITNAETFAADEYLRALYAGANLNQADQARIAAHLSLLTGLSTGFILDMDLRVSNADFERELLRQQGLQAGHYDGRYTLPLRADGGDPVADDPAMGQYVPGFVAALNSYMRDELGVTLPEDYLAIEFRKVNARWDYGSGPGVRPNRNFASDLATAMRRNPGLELFVGSGYYDLATTMGSAAYTVTHSGFPLERVTVRNYESGHMPYLGADSRKRLAQDLREFIQKAAIPER